MNNTELEKLETQLNEQKQTIEKIYKSVEQTRKYFLWTLIITIVIFVLPIIGLVFAIPKFIGIMNTQLNQINLLGL